MQGEQYRLAGTTAISNLRGDFELRFVQMQQDRCMSAKTSRHMPLR
jgi:hypothetical protein